MASDKFACTRARPEMSDEVSALLFRNRQIRPYQAYCVTEASSSRAPSPVAIPPTLLHHQRQTKDFSYEKPNLRHGRHDSPPKSSASHIKPNDNLIKLLSQEKERNQPDLSTNQLPSPCDTKNTSKYHITPTVSPRGSHPLAACQTQVCDAAPSQLRVPPPVRAHVATSKAYQRKAPPRNIQRREMDGRPLPALPKEGSPEGKSDEQPVPKKKKRVPSREYMESGAKGLGSTAKIKQDDRLPAIKTIITSRARPPGKSVTFRDEPEVLVQKDEETPRQVSNNSSDAAQCLSSLELYTPRVALEEMRKERQAHRRTQMNDDRLGRKSSSQIDIARPTPTHQYSTKPVEKILSDTSQPTSSQATLLATSQSSSETPNVPLPPASPKHHHLPKPVASTKPLPHPTTTPLPPSPFPIPSPNIGPRPPPWQSYTNLESQRRSRTEARSKTRLTWETNSSDSMRKGYASTASFDDSPMRREVEEYREQVVRLYPDLRFEGGKGGKGKRRWCWGGWKWGWGWGCFGG